MPSVLTLVSALPFTDSALSDLIAGEEVESAMLSLRAVDLTGADASLRQIAARAADHPIDLYLGDLAHREKVILLCDMDSTIIGQECIDELAVVAGCGASIAAITERAMRGELDFEAALTERVAALAGQSIDAVDDLLATQLTLNEGAQTLVRTMAARGAMTILVSGGFTVFTGPISERAGFAQHYGNALEIDENGTLTGRIIPPILGREAKRERLLAACAERAVDPALTMAIGDGANDLAMMDVAGLGIAYKAKPIVAEAANAAIRHTDLKTALFFQGLREDEFTC